MTSASAIAFPSVEELTEQWTNEAGYFGTQAMWDGSASEYGKMPIPSFDEPFLAFVRRHVELSPDMRVLDIGCGSGVYGLAVAPYAKEVVGVDFSPAMIAAARAKAREHGIQNAEYIEGDFRTVDCKGPYDIVFAHLTPAIAEGRSFAKMARLSSGWCFRAAPVRRTDHTLFGAREACGIIPDQDARDQGFLKELAFVWQSGCTPAMEHYPTTWRSERPLADVRKAYLNGMIAPTLTEEQQAIACNYLEGIAKDGMVRETIDTTIVMMGWHV